MDRSLTGCATRPSGPNALSPNQHLAVGPSTGTAIKILARGKEPQITRLISLIT